MRPGGQGATGVWVERGGVSWGVGVWGGRGGGLGGLIWLGRRRRSSQILGAPRRATIPLHASRLLPHV